MAVVTVESPYTKKRYQYYDNGDPKKGGLKDVYFSVDKQYVVAIFREALDENQKERLKRITGHYLQQISSKEAGELLPQ
jgi:hypothetical protein